MKQQTPIAKFSFCKEIVNEDGVVVVVVVQKKIATDRLIGPTEAVEIHNCKHLCKV